jgi:hypothetical protein
MQQKKVITYYLLGISSEPFSQPDISAPTVCKARFLSLSDSAGQILYGRGGHLLLHSAANIKV